MVGRMKELEYLEHELYRGVRLTPKGNTLFGKAAEVHKRHLSKRLEHVSAQELETALNVLRSLSSKIRTESKKPNRKR